MTEFPSKLLTESLTFRYGMNGSLKHIKSGGENAVFRAKIPPSGIRGFGEPYIQNYVLKVNTLIPRLVYPTNQYYYGPDTYKHPGSIPMPLRYTNYEYYQDKIGEREYRAAWLKQYFGDHVLDENYYNTTISFRPSDALHLFPGADVSDMPDTKYLNTETIVYSQPYFHDLDPAVPAEKKRQTAMLTLPYAERNYIDPIAYAAANNRWLMLDNQDVRFTDEDEATINAVQQSPSLAFMLQVARGKREESLREPLANFVTGAIGWSNSSQEILDLRGKGNVLFFHNRGARHWDYVLIDALNPKIIQMTVDVPYALQKLFEKRPLEEQDLKNLHNGLGYIRSINALAHALGLKERIKLPSIDLRYAGYRFDQSFWDQVYTLLHNNTRFWEKAPETLSTTGS